MLPTNTISDELQEVDNLISSPNARLKNVMSEGDKEDTEKVGNSLLIADSQQDLKTLTRDGSYESLFKYHEGINSYHDYWWYVKRSTANALIKGTSTVISIAGVVFPAEKVIKALMIAGILGGAYGSVPGGFILNLYVGLVPVFEGWQ